MEVNKSITKIRKAQGYSQTDIANILETTQQQYSKYETGAQAIPVIHIKKLSDFYNVTTDELLGKTTFMTTEEGNYKFNKLANTVIDIIYWAQEQSHITENQKDLLIDTILEEKQEIENE